MLSSKVVKEYAKSCGADIVGIASMDRFEGAPKQADPRYIAPDAKSMIVMGFRIPRGTLRGIEEGTFHVAYSSMGYAAINKVLQPMVLWQVTAMLEDAGYEAVPVPNNFPWCNIHTGTGEPRPEFSRPVSPPKPAPDVFIHSSRATRRSSPLPPSRTPASPPNGTTASLSATTIATSATIASLCWARCGYVGCKSDL